MPYRFLASDESLTDALRRIVAEELDAALSQPDLAGATGAIHDVRKRVKKVRAVLRLMRSGFPKGAAVNAVLRDAAQGIGGLRDAEVMLATHDTLFGKARDTVLRQLWQARLEAAQADPDQARRLAAFRTALADVRSGLDGWHVKGKSAHVLAKGLARTRLRGQLALIHARKTTDGDAIHDLRKRVKDLWYQARLMQPVWPAMMAPCIAEADTLGEALGQHHDLSVYRSLVAQMAPTLPVGLAFEAEQRALAAQATTLIKALPAATQLLAGDPADVAGLWVVWWKNWRDQAATRSPASALSSSAMVSGTP